MKQLHIISTGQQTVHEFIEKISLIHPYIDFIHLREKNWTAQTYLYCIHKLTSTVGVARDKIIVNDRVDIAAITKVFGVQLPGHSIPVSHVKSHFPNLQVGCSVHSVDEAIKKEEAGANMLLYGHVFATNSKAGTSPRGVAQLRELLKNVNIPVIAIGGIIPNNVEKVIDTGASGIAVLSGILLSENPQKAVWEYRKKLDSF